MNNIFNLTREELIDYFELQSEKKFRASQVFDWLHNKNITDISLMTNINNKLIDKIKNDFDVYVPTIERKLISKLDGTVKYLIKLYDDNVIETVLMKYKYGYTLCISSQVGCNMGCKFCASTLAGLKRNLETYELLWQIYAIDNDLINQNKQKISHIVIMGTGEPLNNYDNIIKFLNIINDDSGKNISIRNITISTCGIIENIYKLANKNLGITLALSLHAPNDDIRKQIMPIANKYNIEDLVSAMADYYDKTKRKITFEYILISNVNDSIENAKELSKLLLRYLDKSFFNINLIPINEIKESNFNRPSKNNIENFVNTLDSFDISNTVRRELGKDISGSCGQLRYKYMKKEI